MENLKYVGKNLFIEKSSVASIAKKNITPFKVQLYGLTIQILLKE